MPQADRHPRRTVLLSFRFLATAVIGSVLMALVATFGSPSAQLAMLGTFVSIVGGMFLSFLGQDEERERQRAEAIQTLSVPLSLASDPEMFRQYQEICRSLVALAQNSDPILRRIALIKFASVAEQIEGLADGRIVFSLTEEWRTVYEELLRSRDVTLYRSVAWVQSADYWQDEPGRRSMRANFEAARRGVVIERILLMPDELWPRDQVRPVKAILPWIEEQHREGLSILLARESEVGREVDLLVDMGIYGDRAVGVQELDDHCRTLRFTLDLNPQAVRLADARWQRLLLYARPLEGSREEVPSER